MKRRGKARARGEQSLLGLVQIGFRYNIWYRYGDCDAFLHKRRDIEVFKSIASHHFEAKSILEDGTAILREWKQMMRNLKEKANQHSFDPSLHVRDDLKNTDKECYDKIEICPGCKQPKLPSPKEGKW